jgi:hypothetical protein
MSVRTEYPIGATWETRDAKGNCGRVWLDHRHGLREVWKWTWTCSRGKSHEDWNPSRRSAIEECRMCFDQKLWRSIRFKRIA